MEEMKRFDCALLAVISLGFGLALAEKDLL
jgi:hypothetical protein